MSNNRDKMTAEEIEAKFERGFTALYARELRSNSQSLAVLNRQLEGMCNSTVEDGHTHLFNEIQRLIDESGDRVDLTADLPGKNGHFVRKRFLVTPDFYDFLRAAAELGRHAPKDEAHAGEIHKRKVSFGRRFSDMLCRKPESREYVSSVGEALFKCAYDTRAHRARRQIKRNPQQFRQCLMAEANRLAKCKEWRAENQELAERFGECFRILSELIYDLPSGQQPSFDPNSICIKHVMGLWGEEARKGLLTPGAKYDAPNGGTPAPTRKMLVDIIKAHEQEFAPLGVTPDGIRRVFKSMDRRRQRRHKQMRE